MGQFPLKPQWVVLWCLIVATTGIGVTYSLSKFATRTTVAHLKKVVIPGIDFRETTIEEAWDKIHNELLAQDPYFEDLQVEFNSTANTSLIRLKLDRLTGLDAIRYSTELSGNHYGIYHKTITISRLHFSADQRGVVERVIDNPSYFAERLFEWTKRSFSAGGSKSR